MKKKLAVLVTALALFGMAGLAQADLITIGTATYKTNEYNLIWDDDNNGNSVVWLDYTNISPSASWVAQVAWAAGLGDELTINLYEGYTITWEDDTWRLPATVDGRYQHGYDGTTTGGYNITSSEMGHLYYEELGNLGYYDTYGNYQSEHGLKNTGDFENLISFWYFSGTEYAADLTDTWRFSMFSGLQKEGYRGNTGYGLALRSGQVSAVPEPGTWVLLWTGLTGMVALKRRGNKGVAS